MVYPEPIAYADIKIGMPIQADSTWTYLQVTQTLTGVATAVDRYALTLDSGRTVVAPGTDTAVTTTFLRTGDGVIQPDEPPIGSILLDDAGDAWQAMGTPGAIVWYGINGEQLSWTEFLAAHTFTLLADVPAEPLPDPVAPYPTIVENVLSEMKYGMDVRATLTRTATGATETIRGLIASSDVNDPTTDDIPTVIYINRFVDGQGFHIVPVDVDATLVVEQMQAWSADPDWGAFANPEPTIGSVIKSASGVAWQRIEDAPADTGGNPWIVASRGQWKPVTQTFINYAATPAESADYPMAWPYAYFSAAPWTHQVIPPTIDTYTTTWVATDSRTWNNSTGAIVGTSTDDHITQAGDTTGSHGAFVCTGPAVSGDEVGKTMDDAFAGATLVNVKVGMYALTWKGTNVLQLTLQQFAGSTLPATDTTGIGVMAKVNYTAANQWQECQIPNAWIGVGNNGVMVGPPDWLGDETHGTFASAYHADTTLRPYITATYTRTAP